MSAELQKLAMKIGGTYRLQQIDAKCWRAWAEDAGLSGDFVLSLARETVLAILENTGETRDEVAPEYDTEFLRNLSEAITRRSEKCLALLDA